jgi:hypothetical protein
MPLEARSTRRPGDKGTKRWLAQYGDRLLFVRYRHDTDTRERLTTVELIVDRRPAPRACAASPPPAPPASAAVETSLAPPAACVTWLSLKEVRLHSERMSPTYLAVSPSETRKRKFSLLFGRRLSFTWKT